MWYLIAFVVLVLFIGFWPTVILIASCFLALMTWINWDEWRTAYEEWQWRRQGSDCNSRSDYLKKQDQAQREASSFCSSLNEVVQKTGWRPPENLYNHINSTDHAAPNKPNKLTDAAVFAASTYGAYKLVGGGSDRQLEARMLAFDIAQHAEKANKPNASDFEKSYHGTKIIELQAKLAALQVK